MKHSIFIGSSSEGLLVAKQVKAYFSERFEPTLWNEDVFKLNVSYLKSLFDFAILIFTPDDITHSRDKQKSSARDNLIFEQGLFLGRLGTKRAFILCEESVDILSDYSGISISMFREGDEASIAKACKALEQAMKEAINKTEIQLLPSTSLAIGYYENFLKKIDQELMMSNEVKIDGKTILYDDYEFNIFIPERITDLERANLPRLTRNYKKVTIQTRFRPFPFYVEGAMEDGAKLVFYDIPTTLLSSRKAIRKLVTSEFFGKNEDRLKLEQREIINFEMTLRYLINDEYGEDNDIFNVLKDL